jgi:hypothetical protein
MNQSSARSIGLVEKQTEGLDYTECGLAMAMVMVSINDDVWGKRGSWKARHSLQPRRFGDSAQSG